MRQRALALLTMLLLLALMPVSSKAAQPSEPGTTSLAGATLAIDDIDELNPDEKILVFVQLADAPAVEVWQKTNQKSLPGIAELNAKVQLGRINQAQAQVQRQLVQHGATPVYSLQRVLNVIAVDVKVKDVASLTKIPGVIRIERVPIHTLDNATGAALIGAPQLWDAVNGLGLTGEGIKIGVIDSGVDYLHTHFGGTGLAADYAANNTTVITDNMGFPNAKVAGGWDFAGDKYNAGCTNAQEQAGTCTRTAQPDPDPLDCSVNGHGSHVAGTAAGYGVNADGTTYNGPYDPSSVPFSNMHIGPGVAPGAQIYALRVFGCSGSTALTVRGFEWAADPNGDGNFSDHLDVVNLSLGSAYGSNEDLSAQAANNTAAVGTIIVTSAGNSGDYTYISGSPGSATWSIATASIVDSTDVMDAFVVNSPPAAVGFYPNSLSSAYNWAVNGPRTGNLVYPPTQRSACQPFDATNTALITGNIVLIDWTLVGPDANECGSAARANTVATAGGIGVIMVWPKNGFDITIAGNATIPAVVTNKATGDELKAELLQGPVNVTLTNAHPSAIKFVDHNRVDSMSSFSSRGIRRGGALKPDIAAPGQTIFSTKAGSGRYGTGLNGTSMASPHIAGSMALLRELHPTWSVEELKALIMNTAHVQTTTAGQGVGYPHSPARQGAGRASLTTAASSSVVAYNASEPGLVSLSYGTPQVLGMQHYTKQIRVVNKGLVPMTYNISVTEVVTSAGVTVMPQQNQITVQPGSNETFTVEIMVEASQLDRTIDPSMWGILTGSLFPRFFLNEHAGYIKLTPAVGTQLSVPFFIAPRPASNMAATSPMLDFGNDDLATVTLTGTGINNASYTSLAWALQLQEVSPNITQTTGLQNAADIAYIGVGTSLTPTQALTAGTMLYFGVASHAPWSLPSASEVRYDVVVDTNGDNVVDYRIFNSTLTDGNDVFVTGVEKTGQTATTNSFINSINGSVETAPHNTTMMVMPVTAGSLGLTAGNSRFSYMVRTFHREYGNNADTSQTYTFDPAAPALRAIPGTSTGLTDRPMFLDLPGTSFTVERNQASFTLDKPKGMLLLHHFNQHGTQAEVLPVRTYGAAFEAASYGDSGKPSSVVTHTVTISNSGNASDTYDLAVDDDSWTTSLPATVNVPANSTATFNVLVTVPANALENQFDSATVTATSRGNPSVSDDVTINTTAERSYGVTFAETTLSSDEHEAGDVVTYTLTVTNSGNASDVFTIALSGHSWTTSAPTTVNVPAFSSTTFNVQVTVPGDAGNGDSDTVTVTATSQGNANVSDTVTITTMIEEGMQIFLPFLRR